MKILLIGSGRLFRHLQFYFQKKDIHFTTWNRSQDFKLLYNLVSEASHILLAISDSALESFINQHLKDKSKTRVHFSGALNIPGAFSAHPLMSFGPDLYDIQTYEKIHFVTTGSQALSDLLPGLKNNFTSISTENKSMYHALCVLGGNFPILLWTKMSEGLKELGLPEEAARIFLEKILENFNRQGHSALTGPLARKDLTTIQANLDALKNDPFQKVYKAFVEAYQ